MRILGISPDPRCLEELSRALSAQDGVTTFQNSRTSLSGHSSLPVQGEFDVLILDCMTEGDAQLQALGRLLPIYPGLQTVMISTHGSADLLLRALRLGVREVIEPPISRDALLAALRRIEQAGGGAVVAHARIHSFISCKGGSGSTFLATNLGYALAAAEKKRVLLVDLNLQFGDASLFVSDRRPSVTIADLAREIDRVDAGFLDASLIEVLPNFGVLAAPNDPAQSPEVLPAHIDTILRLARTQYDHIIVDAGRSLDSVNVRALDLSDDIFTVLQLTLPFIRDGKRLMELLRSLDYPASKIKPIVNRFEKSELAVEDLERTLGVKIFATIPNHYASVAASVNQGIPILKLTSGSPVSKALARLARKLTNADDKARQKTGSWLGRMFART